MPLRTPVALLFTVEQMPVAIFTGAAIETISLTSEELAFTMRTQGSGRTSEQENERRKRTPTSGCSISAGVALPEMRRTTRVGGGQLGDPAGVADVVGPEVLPKAACDAEREYNNPGDTACVVLPVDDVVAATLAADDADELDTAVPEIACDGVGVKDEPRDTICVALPV